MDILLAYGVARANIYLKDKCGNSKQNAVQRN